MYLADTSIKRPVFATMVIAALVVMGIASYMRANLELMPSIDFPYVIVSTIYPGASPESVESDVTRKIEDAVNTIAGIKNIHSTSRESYSMVAIEFELETDNDIAAQDVRDKISGILSDLPTDIEQPVVQKFDMSARPIVSLVVSGERSDKELTNYAKNFIKRRLETVPGVGSVQLIGGSEREIQIFLDLDKMNALSITPNEVAGAVQMANIELPGGKLNQGKTDMMVRVMGRAKSAEELSTLIIKNSHGKIIRLGDFAKVIDGIKEKESFSRLDGKPAITLSMVKQSGGNTVKVAEGIKERVEQLKKEIPSDINVEIVEDNSVYIRDSIDDVIVNILYGGFLAILVIFLFLTNIRSTMIAALAIPTSIIGTFFLMDMFGFSLNMMTLMGLSLAVGLLIDDAIVVIENIYRHLHGGETPIKAARNATAEIGLAVMATTFSIVVVFLPVAFMSGIIGRFFYQFGITVAGAVVISLFVAFTLTPMLSSRFLKHEPELGPYRPGLIYLPSNLLKWILKTWNNFFNGFNDRYKTTLEWVLHHRLATLMIATLAFIGALGLGSMIPSEFTPEQDQNQIYITFKAGPDASLEETAALAALAEEKIRKYPEVSHILTSIGGEQTPVNEGTILVKLPPKAKRERTVFELIPLVRQDLSAIAGFNSTVATEASEGGGSQAVEYSVRGPDLNITKLIASQFEEIMRQAPGAVDIQNSEKQARPEIQISMDKDVANDLGLSVAGVATTVRNLIDGVVISRLKDVNEEYDIRLQLAPEYRKNIDDIARIKVPSMKKVGGQDYLFDVGNVANMKWSSSPNEIRRYNRQREVRVGCNVATGYATSNISDYLMANLNKINIPPGYDIKPVGMLEIMGESFASIFMAMALAIIFIYLLLASQFESFIDPLAIMLSLPLAVVGALLLMFIAQAKLSIVSLIGIVLLMGLVTKNAILLIDFAKQQRRKGMNRHDALLTAGPVRLRPILMTTLAMIFGMLPLAFGIGPGAEFRAPMAIAIIGGLISSTLLTLVVVPVVYTILDDIAAKLVGHETVQREIEEEADQSE